MARCRISKEKLDTIIDLGNIYLSDFKNQKTNTHLPSNYYTNNGCVCFNNDFLKYLRYNNNKCST